MNTIGINCTKQHVYIAELEAGKSKPRPLPRIAITASDWVSLQECLLSQFEGYDAAAVNFQILRRTSGQYGASVEAIKAEAIVELVAQSMKSKTTLVTSQRIKKILGCAGAEKWQDKAKKLFNGTGDIKYFSTGMDGAMSAAMNK